MSQVLDKDYNSKLVASELDVQELISVSYGSLIEQECKKKLRRVALEFHPVPMKQLFSAEC